MTKRLFILAMFFGTFFIAQGQSAYQTNYYDLVKQVREITKRAFQPLKTSKNTFRQEILEVTKLAHRLEEEALTEALDNPADEKVLDDIAFGCNICNILLEAVELKIKYGTKKHDAYIEKVKSLELAITLQIKTQEKH